MYFLLIVFFFLSTFCVELSMNRISLLRFYGENRSIADTDVFIFIEPNLPEEKNLIFCGINMSDNFNNFNPYFKF